jgi:tripartite-type tricarboxylate transporter receptor subunit TctC
MLGAAGLAPMLGRSAAAQDWPVRPIRMIVPFAPGGGADNTARFVAEQLSQELGQNIVIDNKGGAGGTLGAVTAVNAPADGYTLFYATPGPVVTNPFLMKGLPYDVERDFRPVSLLTRSAYVLVVHPSVNARTVPELIALAKAKPGSLAYSSSGIGAGSHLAGELLRQQAGIEITHVPYRGSAPSIQDVVAGQVPMTIDSVSLLIPLIQSGAVRGLGVTSSKRFPEIPEVPPIADTLPGYEVTVFNGLMARAGTPQPVVDRLSQAIRKIMATPAAAKRYEGIGVEPTGSTPEELGAILRDERAKWGPLITQAGIKAE